MLLRLIRMDPAFAWALRFVAVSALSVLVPTPYSLVLLVGLYSAMMGVALNAGAFQRRCAVYQLSLPVASRTIWLSRVLCFTVLFWAPAVFHLRGGLRVVGAVLALTFLHAMLCSYEPQRDTVPGWWLFLSITGGFAVSLGLEVHPAVWKLTLAGIVVLGLYVWSWSQIQEAFQVAAEEVEPGPDVSGQREISSGWFSRNAPFLRAFVGWQPLIFLLVIPLQTTGLHRGEAALGVVFIPGVVMYLDTALAWMRPTPITRRRIFAWIMGVPLVVYVAAVLLFALIDPARNAIIPIDGRFLAAGFAVSMVLLVVTIQLTLQQRGLAWQMLPKTIQTTAIVVQVGVLLALVLPWMEVPGTHTRYSALARLAHLLASVLPEHAAFLVILGIGSLIGAYIATERMYVMADTPVTARKGEVELWQ